jgi:hypothetical protein
VNQLWGLWEFRLEFKPGHPVKGNLSNACLLKDVPMQLGLCRATGLLGAHQMTDHVSKRTNCVFSQKPDIPIQKSIDATNMPL